MSALDIFRPKDDVKNCIVVNNDGAALTGIIGRQEAEAFAAKVVNGRIGALAGTIECYVMQVTPVARVRDKSIANTDIERIDEEPKRTVPSEGDTLSVRNAPAGVEPCIRCDGRGFRNGEACTLCSGRGWHYSEERE